MCKSFFVGVAFISAISAISPLFTLHAQGAHLCCTAADCKKRHIKPNLSLTKEVHLFGVLKDATGAPFKASKVELRRWISESVQVPSKVVNTDQEGRFDLGLLAPGNYRFLPSETGGFKQPDDVTCNHVACELNLTLQANPTDTAKSICPIR